ncbi:glutaminyl-peptide cyclotransferase-like isoform X1 [Salvia splendens]|uniref:glutaminyl-peptide cyclotransferase-like isoform X1 n=1 Tax=Salvia splendens TaxID=180675 RepID=UPI001C26D03C|nr:glutaminyl-peptide cyclotransferase-like isoform X1 [Salvia splendens]
MAIKSLRKKSEKRPSPSRSFAKYKMAVLLISAVAFACALIFLSISSNMGSVVGVEPSIDRIYDVTVVNEFPHDPNAFTQGLLYAGNDALFESTGLYGHSSVRKVAIPTGKVEAIHKMDYSYFGEGLTLLDDRLFQVNWMTKTGFIYDRNNLSKVSTFINRMKDGWGLAADGQVLFGSDGTSTLYQIDPQTMLVIRNHTVKYKGDEVHNLNELEYVAGEIWANVWQTNCIARISGKTGLVLGWIYLPKLREELIASGNMGIDVLNGIAWDQAQNRIFITGKLWPKLYEIKLQWLKKPFNGDIKRLCMPPAAHFERRP